MPRYYFHLDTSSGKTNDTGIECADVHEAIQYAEAIASQLREGNPIDRIVGRHVVVTDAAGNVVKRVPVIPMQ